MKISFLVLFFCIFLVACQDNSKLIGLEKRLSSAENNLSKMQERIDALRAGQEDLEKTINFNEFMKGLDKVAYLTPGGTGYSTIRFDLGVLTVSLEDIKPYANGSRITLSFGNTLSSSINGLKGTFEWGKVDEKGIPINNLAKSKEIKFSETLVAGSWTKVSVVLEGVPPAEFGFLRLRDFSHSGIRLIK